MQQMSTMQMQTQESIYVFKAPTQKHKNLFNECAATNLLARPSYQLSSSASTLLLLLQQPSSPPSTCNLH